VIISYGMMFEGNTNKFHLSEIYGKREGMPSGTPSMKYEQVDQ